jgi:putative FmdB family regulatory protein
MPMYEFRCAACDHTFEELIFHQSEMSSLVCPECGTTEVNLLMSSFATASARFPASGGSSKGCGPGSFS